MTSPKSIISILKSLRMKEVLLMTGFSFIGVLFTEPALWTDFLFNLRILLFVVFYVMAVYFLNSFADYDSDVQSQRLKSIGQVTRNNYLKLLLVFGFLFSLLAVLINWQVLVFSLAALLLWSLYYLPPLKLKSSFLLGTLIHFLAGMLHFHTGFCSFESYSPHSIAISAFFALLLSIGHFHHEMIDHDADQTAGNRTTAVRLGLSKMHFLRTALTAFTLIYWSLIYYYHIITSTEFLIFLLPTLALLILSAVLKQERLALFQKVNRAAFLLAGLVLVGWRWVELTG